MNHRRLQGKRLKLRIGLFVLLIWAALLPLSPATAASGEVITIDPGHGGRFPGASNCAYSFAGQPCMYEKDVNLDISLRADAGLRALGFQTRMTRTTDSEVLVPFGDIPTWNQDPDGVFRFYPDGKADVKDDLQARVNIANCNKDDSTCDPDLSQANAFVSIHNNSCGGCGAGGTETYHYPGSPNGQRLAELIHEEVVKRIGRTNRGVKSASFYVLHWTRMPAALLEGSFMDNPQEAELLLDPAFRQAIAEGVVAGVSRFFGENEVDLIVPAFGRSTVSIGAIPGWSGTDVATTVVAQQPLVAERAMYFSSPPNGGTGAVGTTAPSTTWYFAEGYTAAGFTTFLLIFNPGDQTSSVNLRLLGSGGTIHTSSFDVPPHRRRTLTLNGLGPPGDVSAEVTSSVPVVAERAVYSSGEFGEAHVSPGATSLSLRWYFAEGYTGPGFTTFVLLANPGAETARAAVELLPEGGSPLTVFVDIPGSSRRTVSVNEVLPGANVGISVVSDRQVIAERSMYQSSPQKGATNVVGAPAASTSWHFAEGYTGPGFTTFLLLANPGDLPAEANVVFSTPGSGPTFMPTLVPPHSRVTISENVHLPNREVAATITSLNGVPIVAERAMYFSAGAAGAHASMGAPSTSAIWFFAEGFTGPGFSTFILLHNPTSEPISAKVKFERP